MCDVTHSYVWRDSFICVTWLIHMCDVTHWYVWHYSSICVTWLIHMRDMTHWYVWRGSFVSLHTPDYPITKTMIYTYLFKSLQLIKSSLQLFQYVTWRIRRYCKYMYLSKAAKFSMIGFPRHTATLCNTLQHTLLHALSHRTRSYRKTYSSTPVLQHSATLYYTLQHTLLDIQSRRTKIHKKTYSCTHWLSDTHNHCDTHTKEPSYKKSRTPTQSQTRSFRHPNLSGQESENNSFTHTRIRSLPCCNTLQHCVAHCNTYCHTHKVMVWLRSQNNVCTHSRAATCCNTVLHTATHTAARTMSSDQEPQKLCYMHRRTEFVREWRTQ